VGRTRAESKVKVEIVRDSKPMTLTIEVGLLDSAVLQGPADRSSSATNLLSLEVRELSAEEKAATGISKGVLVTRVFDGPGRTAGIEVGDVITTLNSEWVDGSRFAQRLEALPRDVAIPVRIVRDQRPEFLVIKIPG
jgi:serine protease Do